MHFNHINFDFFETSSLENIKWKDEKKSNLSCILDFSEKYKDNIKNLLEEHNALVAKRKIYQILENQEYIKNSGLALEYFLIEYLKDIVKIDKRNPEKWESKGIDFFLDNIGIQMTVANRTKNKEEKLLNLREKINGEFQVEDIKGLGLLNFNSDIIVYLVNSGNRFLENIKNLENRDIIDLYFNLEIFKKGFLLVISKIKELQEDKSKIIRLKNGEKFILANEKEYREFKNNLESKDYTLEKVDLGDGRIKYIKKYKENINEIKPDFSNVSYNYCKNDQVIIFKIYKEFPKGKKEANLIASFKYFICN